MHFAFRAYFPRRQALLFLIAILVSCAVLVVLGLQTMAQERQLEEMRLAEDLQNSGCPIRYPRWRRRFEIASNATTVVNVDSPALSTGVWVHLVGVYEPGTAVRIYVNAGTPTSNTTSIPASQFNNTLNVNLGRRPDGSTTTYLDGTIDDARVYNRALTASEITAIYNAGL